MTGARKLRRMRRPRRLRAIVVLSVFFSLVAGTGAFAYWGASDRVEASASSATVGQTQSATSLNHVYNAVNHTVAGSVTIENTGSREATYALVLAAKQATQADLPAAISIRVAPVTDAESCTPEAELESPTTGTFSLDGSFEVSGAIEAAGTVVLCVQTSMTPADSAALANESAEFTLRTGLDYAASDGWQTTADSIAFTQSVGPDVLFFVEDDWRYVALNQGICIRGQRLNDGRRVLGRNTDCGDGWESEWRISRAGDGTFAISWAYNDPHYADDPRWSALAPGNDPVRLTAPADVAEQRWIIGGISSTEYRIESVAYPGHCIAISDQGLYNPDHDNPRRVVLEECDDASAGQKFSFDRVGDPSHEVEEMVSGGSSEPWQLQLGFSQNVGYQGETRYRVFFARESTPGTRVEVPRGSLQGWYTVVQIGRSDQALVDFVNSADGDVGNTWVYVEQSVERGDWKPAAQGKFRITREGSELRVWSGWQP